jgi:bacterioferritin-associated ferredoxin
MYVCICKAVTDTQIKQAIDSGACTRRQLFNCLGIGGDCGKCNSHIKEMFGEKLQQQSIMQAV